MKHRVIGYDLARSLALFGMVVVNFKIVMGAAPNGPLWLSNLAALLEGRAAATFVVLAGVGISLLSRKSRETGDRHAISRTRNSLLKRACFLFVVGLLYTPLWPADILNFYGIYIAVAAFLFTSSTLRLSLLSGLLLIGFSAMLFLFDYEQGWNWQTFEYQEFWSPLGMLRRLFFNGFHPVIPWLAFLLLGMIIGRLEMTDRTIRNRVLKIGIAVAVSVETASWLLTNSLSADASVADQEIIAALFGTSPMPPMPLYMLAGAGVACAIIAASVSLGIRCADHRWIKPLVSTGQLALTLYVAHVVVGMGCLEAIGRLENQPLVFSLSASITFFIASVAFATLWRSRFERGPIEMLMHLITAIPKRARGTSPKG